MKKLLSYALMSTFALSTIFVSCKKDSDSGSGGNASASGLGAGQALVKANISGAHSSGYESNSTMSSAVNAGTVITITAIRPPGGLDGATETFWITLPADIQTGTYKTTDFSGKPGGIFTYSTAKIGGAQLGWQADPEGETVFNFTISKITATEIEGTFNGEMSNDNDNTKITANGSFAGKFK